MGVRSAVLLSGVFIGFVVLYLVTRNQWNWIKLMRRLMLGLLLSVGSIGGWIYWSSLPPTSPVSEFWGISLGSSKSGVRFLKGEPSEIVEPGTWVYVADRGRTYHLVFGDTDEIIRILAVSGPGFGSRASLLGVRTGFGTQRLVDQLGEPSRVLRLPDDLRRAYLYTHLNAVFILEQSAVVSYGIYDVEGGDPYTEGGDEVGRTSSR
jgi:hypothetical protein